MMTAVIVDDETLARESLQNMLKLFYPNLEVIGEADNVATGIETIKRLSPDVVFLDVQMPDGTGFDLLSHFKSINFKFVIITAYQEYAIKAFKFSAIDYILKPIDPADLINAIERLYETIREEETNSKFRTFIENIKINEKDPQKLLLKTLDEVVVASVKNIIRCESQNNYTMFYFTDRPRVLVSKTLKEYEDLLSSSGFFRVHQSHLVNLLHISKYNRFPDSSIILSTNEHIPVAVRKRNILLELLKKK
ncbi:MAG: LytTR family DNA-binding domain-containing protein [Bacteroidales bacterium]|nr:LytTR family DNA-binding domain-containing protein [Tenuifilaceae bacterium]